MEFGVFDFYVFAYLHNVQNLSSGLIEGIDKDCVTVLREIIFPILPHSTQ